MYRLLDRELLSGIDHDPVKQNQVKRFVFELHSKNILVVAEGVEEKEEFDYLVGLGVDLFLPDFFISSSNASGFFR